MSDNWTTMHCPIHLKDFKVYAYLVGVKNGKPVIQSNGCEQCNNSTECKQCMAAAERILTERFLSTDSLPFHPLSEDGR